MSGSIRWSGREREKVWRALRSVDFSRAFLSLPFSPFRNTRLNGDTIPGCRKRKRKSHHDQRKSKTQELFSVWPLFWEFGQWFAVPKWFWLTSHLYTGFPLTTSLNLDWWDSNPSLPIHQTNVSYADSTSFLYIQTISEIYALTRNPSNSNALLT